MEPSSSAPCSSVLSSDRIISDVEGQKLRLTLMQGERVYCGGYAIVKVISGSLQILGAILSEADDPMPIYSPKSTSLLYLSPALGCAQVYLEISALHQGLEVLQEGQPNAQQVFCTFPEAASTCIPNFYLPSLKPADDTNCIPFDIPADWMHVAEGLCSAAQGVPIVFVAGPRKVGKSSMTRYLANSLWNAHRQVAFMDLDVGQTEFTPPGCLSLQLLKKPLLGPPFTHQGPVQTLSFLGTTSPADDPKAYVAGAKNLASAYLSQILPGGVPLVVNTMGWVTGLGLSFLQSLLHLLPVTHLVAFGQRSSSESFDYVNEALFSPSPTSPKPFTAESAPQVAYVQPAESSGSSGARLNRIAPSELRALTFSSYFLGKFDEDLDRMVYPAVPPTFRLAKPLTIPISQIRIIQSDKSVKIPERLELLAANLAVVGLACMNLVERSLQCVGLGVVRSVDKAKGLFYVLTPIPAAELQAKGVNTFILGRIYLPALFLTHNPANAEGPYISYTSSALETGSTQRKPRANLARKYTDRN